MTKKNKKLKAGKAAQQPPEVEPRVKMPDFRARLRRIYGDKIFKVSGAEVVRWDRNRY